MSPPERSIRYHRYRAPQVHGERLLDPPADRWPALVAQNQALGSSRSSAGLPDPRAARAELLELAVRYSRVYRDVPPRRSADAPIVVSGHQPRLFHPGVWVKNFLLDEVARRVDGTAINLVVDNDLGGSASIRVPAGTIAAPRQENVAYDRNADEIPWEERVILDRSTLESFADRVGAYLKPFGLEPLLKDWWPAVVGESRRDPNLGRCVAAARHQLEGQWGLATLEVPLSQLCETDSFRQFVLQLFADAEAFSRHYNEQLSDYRGVHRIRSRSHPVPALERTREGWHELPLWVWTQADPRRRRLFVRRTAAGWSITDRHRGEWSLPSNAEGQKGVGALAQLSAAGVRIRPRALVTTMYSRLVLSDLFLHGIGGGKYDQLTDAIARAWLKIEPPEFVVATATARLPIPHDSVTPEQLRHVEQRLRRLTYNPDEFLKDRPELQPWVDKKRAWLAEQPDVAPEDGRGAERHATITRIQAHLNDQLHEERQELETRREFLEEQLRAERVLSSREYAFCLFPESALRALLLDNR